jgi:hypothetical protein
MDTAIVREVYKDLRNKNFDVPDKRVRAKVVPADNTQHGNQSKHFDLLADRKGQDKDCANGCNTPVE